MVPMITEPLCDSLVPQGGVQEPLKGSTIHRRELNCSSKLSPQPPMSTHIYTPPNLPTVEKQPCDLFPVTKIFHP